MQYKSQSLSPATIANLLKMDLSSTSTNLSLAIANEIKKFNKEGQENCLRNLENILIAYKQS